MPTSVIYRINVSYGKKWLKLFKATSLKKKK